MNAIAQPSAPAAGPQLDNRRVLAALVDLLIIAAGSFVLGFLIGMLGGGFGGSMNLIFVGWALYYYFAFESGDGQTPGKKLLKLRVVRADGGATSMREIAVRTVLRVVDGLFVYLVGLVTMLVTGQRRQRLGDLAAGTIVVDAGETPSATEASAPAAVAVPVARKAPEGVYAPEPESYDASEPEPEPAGSPVDIGTPLPGTPAPEQPDIPAVTDFEPFSEPELPEPAPEPQPVQPEPVPEQQEPEPVAEATQVQAEPAQLHGVAPFTAPSHELPAPEPVVEERQAEAAPEPVGEATSYESEPEAPSYEVELEAPVYEQPQVEDPQVEEPQPEGDLAPEPAYEAPAEEPQVEIETEPASNEEPQEEQITVRPMDAPVSGMDLLMAEDEADSSDGEPPQSA